MPVKSPLIELLLLTFVHRSTTYFIMPGKLKAKIVAGRHLPVMDRASDLTDAFVEVSEGVRTKKKKILILNETTHIYINIWFKCDSV